jgi:hypothetical protein
MKQHLQKIIALLGISISLAFPIQSLRATNIKDAIEIVTALLRGPAAHFECELQNDTSHRACIKRAIIHAIRLINDCCAAKGIQQLGYNQFGGQVISVDIPGPLSVYDTIQIVKNVRTILKNKQQEDTQQNHHTAQTIPTTKNLEVLQRFILPAVEMLAALARIGKITTKIPLETMETRSLAGQIIYLSRYTQLFYASPKRSTQRKLLSFMLTLTILNILGSIAQIGTRIHAERQQNAEHQHNESAEIERQGHGRKDLETLGLDPNTIHTQQEIKTAYRQLALKIHPDRGGRGTTEQFKMLQAAYERLLGIEQNVALEN